jgi:hypothetical protein
LAIVNHIVGKEFESDKAVKVRIFGLIDHTHSAPAKFFEDAVVRDCLAD